MFPRKKGEYFHTKILEKHEVREYEQRGCELAQKKGSHTTILTKRLQNLVAAHIKLKCELFVNIYDDSYHSGKSITVSFENVL